MKKIFFIQLGLLVSILVMSQDPTSINPNNSEAVTFLNWKDNIPRIRYGGIGIGATNGFQIQGPGDNVKFSILDNGYIGIGTSTPYNKLEIYENNGKDAVAQFRTQDGSIFIAAAGNTTVNSSYGNYISSRNSGNTTYKDLGLKTAPGIPQLIVKTNGSIAIGTSSTGSHKLAVEGSIGAREIQVEASGWSDFVFKNDYKLKSLEETEQFILKNKHLPDIPNEAEVKEKGVNLGEMDAKLLQKIEELTLHLIEQNKEIKNLRNEINELKGGK